MQQRIGILVIVLALVAAACSSSPDAATSGDDDNEIFAADDDTTSETATTAAPVEQGEATDETTVESTTTTTAAPAPERPVFGPTSLVPDCIDLPDVSIGLSTDSVTSSGNEYTYQWTVPSSYDGSPLAVVFDFHGIGSNGAQQAVFSGWAAAAELEGFLSVQPTGLAVGDDRASWELPQFDTDERDDITMVVDLIEDISNRICIDPARIYATGMSNGGLLTSTLVCALSERIAAAVSVAGVTHHESCAPTRAVPYLAFHGTDDEVVPFNGGGESSLDGADLSGGFFEQVIPDEFAEFASSSGCTESTDSEVTPEVTLTSYSGCDDDVPLGFYTIAGGGHTWPGSTISAAIPSLGVTNTDISATEIAWDFFTQYTLAGPVSETEPAPEEEAVPEAEG